VRLDGLVLDPFRPKILKTIGSERLERRAHAWTECATLLEAVFELILLTPRWTGTAQTTGGLTLIAYGHIPVNAAT
jgi:hypothetical protein